MKKGILIVSFGTTYKDTREKNIDQLTQTVREHFPDWNIYEAYSSDKIRAVLRKRDGFVMPGTREALLQMEKDGITHAAVLPTHIIDGIENNRMKQTIEECRDMFVEIKTAEVLLKYEEDYVIAANIFWDCIKHRAEDCPVVLMGHGSAHIADKSYGILEQKLQEVSGRGIYIATVEGKDSIDITIKRLKKSGMKKGRLLLHPFMLVAGDHARNDMAGLENSFVAKLTEQGYQPECILKGIGEYEEIRKIYIRHLSRALEKERE